MSDLDAGIVAIFLVVVDHEATFLGLAVRGDVVQVGVVVIIFLSPEFFVRREIIGLCNADISCVTMIASFAFFLIMVQTLFLAFYFKNKIDKLLGNCEAISNPGSLFSQPGVWSGITKLGTVAAIFLLPKTMLKHGFIEPAQVKAFPPTFKYIILIHFVMTLSVFFVLGMLRLRSYLCGV